MQDQDWNEEVADADVQGDPDDVLEDELEDQALEQPVAEPTGNPTVDAVTAAVADLSDRPVAEHVAVFEDAHERLRRALEEDPAVAESVPQD